jgi:hypothetical protein
MPEMKNVTGHGYSSLTQLADDRNDHLKARQRWDSIVQDRTNAVSQGDNFNPWTTVKQNFAAIPLYLSEKRLSQGSGVDYTAQREKEFEEKMNKARQKALQLESQK